MNIAPCVFCRESNTEVSSTAYPYPHIYITLWSVLIRGVKQKAQYEIQKKKQSPHGINRGLISRA